MNYENYDPSFPDQPVVDLYLPIWGNLPAFKSKPAFIWLQDDSNNGSTLTTTTTTSLTYSQLNDSVHSISSQLLTIPLQRGETVVVLCSPGLELVKIIFACQRSGLLCVPISPPDPLSTSKDQNHHHHLIRVLSQTKPKAAIANRSYITKVFRYINSSNDTKLAHMLQNLTWIAIEDVKVVNPKFDYSSYNGCKADEVYLIQYTSGATAIPKPVLVTAGSAAHNVRTARRAYDLHPNSVIVSWLPQYHDCGLMFLLLTIVSGSTCVLTSPFAFVKRPRLWLEMISNFNATCTPVPSFTLPLVVKRGGIEKGTTAINLQSLRNLIIINEPIYKSTAEEFLNVFRPFGLNPSSISPSYGLAENCTFVSTSWRSFVNNMYSSFPNFPCHNKLLPSARLRSTDGVDENEDMEIVILNEETLEPVEDGIEGEIVVSSPSNASGYLGHPSLTHEVFHGRLGNKSNRCFIRTGDRGVVKGEERFLFVTGRCVDVIKLSNNEEIHAHYIEKAAYNSCPQCLRGGCLAAFKVGDIIVVVAEIQRNIEKEVGVLRRICEGVMRGVLEDERSVEVGFVVLVKSGSVPKTTSGKVKRWAAKENLRGGKMKVVMEMPFGELRTKFDEEEGNGGGKLGGAERKEMAKEKWEGSFLLFSNAPINRPSLLSLL